MVDTQAVEAKLREEVISLYSKAYPGSTKNDAWSWRLSVCGKASTKDWTVQDWLKAKKKLMEKLGLGKRKSKTPNKLQEELL